MEDKIIESLIKFLKTTKVSDTDVLLLEVLDLSLVADFMKYTGFSLQEIAYVIRDLDYERQKMQLKKQAPSPSSNETKIPPGTYEQGTNSI
jgi:hypothetical protein